MVDNSEADDESNPPLTTPLSVQKRYLAWVDGLIDTDDVEAQSPRASYALPRGTPRTPRATAPPPRITPRGLRGGSRSPRGRAPSPRQAIAIKPPPPIVARLRRSAFIPRYAQLGGDGGTEIPAMAERALTLRQLRQIVGALSALAARDGWRNPGTGDPYDPDLLTLAQLVELLIKPACERRRCSMAECLASGPQPPDYFVSACLSEPAANVLTCLEQHAADHGLGASARYWLWPFAHNFHAAQAAAPPGAADATASGAGKGSAGATGGAAAGDGSARGDRGSAHDPEPSERMDDDAPFRAAIRLARGAVVVVDPAGGCAGLRRAWVALELHACARAQEAPGGDGRGEGFTLDFYAAARGSGGGGGGGGGAHPASAAAAVVAAPPPGVLYAVRLLDRCARADADEPRGPRARLPLVALTPALPAESLARGGLGFAASLAQASRPIDATRFVRYVRDCANALEPTVRATAAAWLVGLVVYVDDPPIELEPFDGAADDATAATATAAAAPAPTRAPTAAAAAAAAAAATTDAAAAAASVGKGQRAARAYGSSVSPARAAERATPADTATDDDGEGVARAAAATAAATADAADADARALRDTVLAAVRGSDARSLVVDLTPPPGVTDAPPADALAATAATAAAADADADTDAAAAAASDDGGGDVVDDDDDALRRRQGLLSSLVELDPVAERFRRAAERLANHLPLACEHLGLRHARTSHALVAAARAVRLGRLPALRSFELTDCALTDGGLAALASLLRSAEALGALRLARLPLAPAADVGQPAAAAAAADETKSAAATAATGSGGGGGGARPTCAGGMVVSPAHKSFARSRAGGAAALNEGAPVDSAAHAAAARAAITAREVSEIVDALAESATLTTLDLDSTALDGALWAALGRCTSLRALRTRIGRTAAGASHSEIVALGGALRAARALETVEIVGALESAELAVIGRALGTAPALRRLVLETAAEAHLGPLCHAIRSSITLGALQLTTCLASYETVANLANAVEASQALSSLVLVHAARARGEAGDKGPFAVGTIKALARMPRDNRVLVHLSLDEVCDALAKLLADLLAKPRGTRLQRLELTGSRSARHALGAAGLAALANALASTTCTPTLAALALHGYEPAEPPLRSFLHALAVGRNATLVELDLRVSATAPPAWDPSDAHERARPPALTPFEGGALEPWQTGVEDALLNAWLDSGRSEQRLWLPFSEPVEGTAFKRVSRIAKRSDGRAY